MSYKLRVVFACFLLGSLLVAGWAPPALADDGGAQQDIPWLEQLVAWGSDLWAQLTGSSAELGEPSPDPEGDPDAGIGGYIDPRG